MKALNTYLNLLTTQPKTVPAFIYAFSQSDRTYGPPLYPAPGGTFNKTTTPWLNDIEAIPHDQLWTTEDLASSAARAKQSAANQTLAETRVPQATYSGSVVDQVVQRYSKGFFNTEAAPFLTVPAMIEHWIADDAEYARQRLGADNPNVLSRYTGTSGELDALLQNGSGAKDLAALRQQLQGALAQQKLYACDYGPVLGKVQTIRQGQFWTVPIAFFVLDDATQALLPAGIQLCRGEYWFTPADAANAWLLAKLHAASADAQWWFSGTHLFNSHSIDMIFGIAALVSGLPRTHPIYMLLDPHLKKVYNINNVVYNAAAPAGGGPGIYHKGEFVDQQLPTGRIGLYEIVNALYQDYHFEEQAFPNILKARGVDSASFPGSFPYRDDGQVWWDALAAFTSDIVEATYATDAEVKNDPALSAWLSTVEDAFNHDGCVRFSFKGTKDDLKSLMTNLSFLTTAQHTAVNNTMFDGLALVPNGAFAMAKAAPKDAQGITDQDVYDSLPDPKTGIETVLTQIGFVMAGTATIAYLAACDAKASPTCLHSMYPYGQGTKQYAAVEQFSKALSGTAGPQILKNQAARVAAFQKQNPNAKTVPNSVRYGYLAIDKVMACIQI